MSKQGLALPCLLQARVLDSAYLWYLLMGNNIGHGMAEEVR